jgi:hypothetical protein
MMNGNDPTGGSLPNNRRGERSGARRRRTDREGAEWLNRELELVELEVRRGIAMLERYAQTASRAFIRVPSSSRHFEGCPLGIAFLRGGRTWLAWAIDPCRYWHQPGGQYHEFGVAVLHFAAMYAPDLIDV